MTRLLVAILCIAGLADAADATPTNIVVRVLSKDAKFIGTSMNGVSVKIEDVASGEILAQGKTAGSTGDTRRIMRQPGTRRKALSTKGSANYSVTLDLEKPTQLKFVAEGPLSNPDSANQVSVTQWIIPGKHLTGGDGVLLEIPGFSVSARSSVAVAGDVRTLTIWAKVTMMCGCPIAPGGLWDANDYEVAAILTDQEGGAVTIPLQFAGKTSLFSGSAKLAAGGPLEALIYAYDPANGNTGVDIVSVEAP